MDKNVRIENIGEAVILTADIVCADDVIALANALDAQHREGAIFFCDTSTGVTLRRLKTWDYEYLWGGKTWETPMLGHKVRLQENLPTVTEGEHTVIFASRAYAIQQGWAEWPIEIAMKAAAKKASRIILVGMGGLCKNDENFAAFVDEGARIILRECLYAVEKAIQKVFGEEILDN